VKHIIQVDDDPSHNVLCKAVLKRVFSEAKIDVFLSPEKALEFIENEFITKDNLHPVTLFLDINMPTMSGWEFLEEFKKFPAKVHEAFTIYILSSSVDMNDIEKASSNKFVSDFISKPLKVDTIKKIFSVE
jgi:CheY-like chemotaxis protein